jgi:hypothetical protein
MDARHISLEDVRAFQEEAHPEATPNAVSMVHVVSADVTGDWESCDAIAREMRRSFTDATLAVVLLPNLLETPALPEIGPHIDLVAKSFEEAAQYTLKKFMP